MARRQCIRGGTLLLSGSLLAACLFSVQASAQDNSGLASQVLLTQPDLPSSYSPAGPLNTQFPDSCTGGNTLLASIGSTPGSTFGDGQSVYPVVNGIGSDAVVGDNTSESQAAFTIFSSQTFWNCLNAASDSQDNVTSNGQVSQLPDPGVGDQSSEVALSFTDTGSDGSSAGFSDDIVIIRVGQILGEVSFASSEADTTQAPDLQIPPELQTQLTNLFVSRMRTAEAQVRPPPSCTPALNAGQPRYVVLLADGIDSATESGSPYNPLEDTYCFPVKPVNDSLMGPPSSGTRMGTPPPLKSILDDYINGFSSNQDEYLTNVLGAEGAVIIPFSYGTPSASFSGNNLVIPGADRFQPGLLLPTIAANLMQGEISQIHKHWPKAQIEVIGHSEGGLVAETWWLNHGINSSEGVQNVFSLDSPINGVQDAFVCGVIATVLCQLGGVGQLLGDDWIGRWVDQPAVDQQIIAADNGRRPWYFPVGTEEDPVYRVPDDPANSLMSQLVFSGCSGFVVQTCNPANFDVSSSCLPSQAGDSWYDIGGHGLVMNCDSVVSLEACFLIGQDAPCPQGGSSAAAQLSEATRPKGPPRF